MTIPDLPLPPLLRKAQQSWAWQVIGLPLTFGFGSAILVGGCLSHGIGMIERACVMGALNSTIVSFLTVIFSGHSAGSANFASDGTTIEAVPKLKQLADTAISLKEKVPDPASPVTPEIAASAAKRLGAVEAGIDAQNTIIAGEVKRAGDDAKP